MKLKIYQADAFAKALFKGNPAAVIPLQEWLPDETMQNIAMENNLSETAFFIPEQDQFHIRWFTPATEVSLCGHATLATAHILFNELNYKPDTIELNSLSGLLTVKRNKDFLELNFPADNPIPIKCPDVISQGIGIPPVETYRGKTDYLLIYNDENDIQQITPDFGILKKASTRGVIVSAAGSSVDFVSRFFAPAEGIDEDPVTGSAHTLLTPYWSHKLKKTTLTACQLSARGGSLQCSLLDNRVLIAGKAHTYLRGEIEF